MSEQQSRAVRLTAEVLGLDDAGASAYARRFIAQTVGDLNGYTARKEQELFAAERQITQLEIAATLLEAKLSNLAPAPADVANHPREAPESDTANLELPEAPADPWATLSGDPVYATYVKMLRFGVPEPQVRQRMAMDGVDPAPLDALAATSAMP